MPAYYWRGAAVLPDRLIEDAAVVFEADRILWVGPFSDVSQRYPSACDTTPAGTRYVTPGFVDVHTHGGGGESFPSAASIEQVKTAADQHLRFGTTTLNASLVTAAKDVLIARAQLLAQAAEQGIVQGIHFEGPFLSEARCGAQDPRFLADPTPGVMGELLEAAGGYAVAMTIAPERAMNSEGMAALKVLTDAGAIPSWGHTDGGIRVTNRAIEEGAELLKGTGRRASVTHLFNGMRPLHHRHPGPISCYLKASAAGQVVSEMICDGVHLDPELVANIIEIVGRENCVFVSDAMAAVGVRDGEYVLGSQEVRVEAGVARLTRTGSLAGGTSHISDCVRVAVQDGGVDLVDAVFLGTLQGARMFGWDDRGQLGPGLKADLCALSEDLRVQGVVRAGELV